ncbi:hypothetical protein LEP1GSC170_0253, partial [Leptospira interrogans serovar Bataviae str. HAI135]
ILGLPGSDREEKLSEELLCIRRLKNTSSKIKIAAPLENQEATTFVARFNELLTLARANKEREIFWLLKLWFPNTKSTGII